jgi:hypothetical protein
MLFQVLLLLLLLLLLCSLDLCFLGGLPLRDATTQRKSMHSHD